MTANPGNNPVQKKTSGGIRNLFVLAGNLVFIILILLIASMVFFLVQNKISGGLPKVFGHHMYIVLSGSMAPEFDTGSTVFVKPKEPSQIQVGDIITFRGVSDPNALTTHRVVDIDKTDPQNLQFITKGDANEVVDPSPVPGNRLVGTISFSIPYLGYLLNYGQTKQGMVFMVMVPGVLLIIMEISKLFKAAMPDDDEDDNGDSREAQDSQSAADEEGGEFNQKFWN